jgi:hypothetical protein
MLHLFFQRYHKTKDFMASLIPEALENLVQHQYNSCQGKPCLKFTGSLDSMMDLQEKVFIEVKEANFSKIQLKNCRSLQLPPKDTVSVSWYILLLKFN